jgi:hypothetical protein
MPEPVNASLAAFFRATGASEVHAARISNGPSAGWTTRLRLLVPEAPISDRTPAGFAGSEIDAGPDGQALRDALAPLLPEGPGAGARAVVAARGAWLLLDPQTPRLVEIDPAGALPRVESPPHLVAALATADVPDGHWRRGETSAHARLAAEIAFAALDSRLAGQAFWPTSGTLHLLCARTVRALLHAPGPRRIHLLAVARQA